MANYYFNKNSWEINTTGPGIALPTVFVLPATAVLGFAFLMFMPLIGFVLSVNAIYRKIRS